MKNKLIVVGFVILAMAVWGISLPDKELRFVVAFVATLLSAMLVVTLLDGRVEYKGVVVKKRQPLRFLIVCEWPLKSHNKACVADAVSDWLAYLFLDTGSTCDFVSVVDAVQKVAENMKRPKSERYKIVFIDASVVKERDYLEGRIQLRIGDKVGPVIVLVGNLCPGYFAQLRFTPEAWSKDRKIFQTGLETLLQVLNFFPEGKGNEVE